MIKKLILIILLLTILCLLSSCCTTQATENTEYKFTAFITYGNDKVITTNVAGYTRVSNGWIVITADNGLRYATNEINVLIIREPINGLQ